MNDTAAIIEATGHRPWPLPSIPWILFQSWRDLLFAHWPLDPGPLRFRIPAPLELDTFDGRAWIGLTPFRIQGLRPRLLPPVPGTSDFPELNLRTYVSFDGRPGIYFFSLDAGSRLAVAAARAFYALPYHAARMRLEHRDGGWIDYESERERGPAAFLCRYRPVGPVSPPVPGSIEHFLTERYALYTVLRRGRVLRTDIHHVPWPLQQAEAEIELNTVPAAHGFDLPGPPELLHFSARQDSLVWAPQLAS